VSAASQTDHRKKKKRAVEAADNTAVQVMVV
jgi:hypothetical protein